jgi:hypothetical protein
MTDCLAELSRLRSEVRELRAERDSLEKLLDGNIPPAASWLQSKVWRQRRALDRLERRNGTLRFALRLMNELREPVTAAEWSSARAAIDNESRRGRINEQVPAVS